MASIQQFVCDAEIFPRHVIQQKKILQDVEKKNHFAALKIQRAYRGYVVRKEISMLHDAATVIQKNFRRFLVENHLPDLYKKFMDHYCAQKYNESAVRIQAFWRGYWVRKNNRLREEQAPLADHPLYRVLSKKVDVESINNEMRMKMRAEFRAMANAKQQGLEKDAREWVLYILFRLHHCIRTYHREGVYSLHNKKKLSNLEKMLRSIRMSEYMKALKIKYYKEIKKHLPPPTYVFSSKKLHELEDLYQTFLKEHGTRPVANDNWSIHKTPFKLSSKVSREKYQREILRIGKYPPEEYVIRKTEAENHVSNKDFDLQVLNPFKGDLKPPPYYIDFWHKVCDLHNIP